MLVVNYLETHWQYWHVFSDSLLRSWTSQEQLITCRCHLANTDLFMFLFPHVNAFRSTVLGLCGCESQCEKLGKVNETLRSWLMDKWQQMIFNEKKNNPLGLVIRQCCRSFETTFTAEGLSATALLCLVVVLLLECKWGHPGRLPLGMENASSLFT